MALTFKDLTIEEIYPVYVIKGNKVETKRIKPTDSRGQGHLLCLFMDKLGRQTHDWWGSGCYFAVSSKDMEKSSIADVYFPPRRYSELFSSINTFLKSLHEYE